MVVILALSFLLLLVGNALLEYSGAAFHSAYTDNLSGEMTVSAAGESTFTLFGSDALLVGEYQVPPTLVNFAKLQQDVDEIPEVRASAGVVTSAARVEIESRRVDQALFGVRFDDYSRLFPQLEVLYGSFPTQDRPGLMVQEHHYENLLEREIEVVFGETPALLTVAYDNTFAIREVPISGVYRYPVRDQVLDRVALIDVQTARALNGYVYGSLDAADIPESQRDLFESDDLFGDADDFFGEEEDIFDEEEDLFGEADPLTSLEQYMREAEDDVRAAQTIDGAWNHLLIGLYNEGDMRRVRRSLQAKGYTGENEYLVRDWRQAVGGTALLVWYLRVMLNAGLLFVAFGAAIITTNALVLSVLERTREIGTMRALGATRGRVSLMVFIESLLVVLGSASVGLVLGGLLVLLLNAAGIVIDNQYIQILFGGGPVQGRVTASLVAYHLLAALLLGGVAMLYPLKKALGIGPATAMAE